MGRRIPAQVGWVISLDVVLFVIAASLAFRHEPHIEVFALAPLVIAVALALCDHSRIQVLNRRESLNFSLLQVPVIAGVIVLPGIELLAVAAAVWLFVPSLVGRKSLLKSFFNLSNKLLNVATTIVVFDLYSPPVGFSWPTLLAAVVASCAGTVLSTAMIILIIAVSERALDLRSSAESLAFAAFLAATSATFTVPLLELMVLRTGTTTFLVGLLPVYLIAYRSLVARRYQRERLHFFTKLISPLTGGNLSEIAAVLLSETASAFRARYVELLLWHDDVGIMRFRHCDGETIATYPDAAEFTGLKVALDTMPVVASLRSGSDRAGPVGQWLADSEVEEALVGCLQWDSSKGAHTVDNGVLVVADRVGPARRFDAAELELFTTLRFQVASALEAARLERAVIELREHKQALSDELHHDSLTRLPNRLHLSRHLSNLVVGTRGIELLFIDLDDFKLVNDVLGHTRGDELLVEIAQRIEACLGPHDFLARLGGDEFAVSVRGIGEGAQLAGRIVETVRQPLTLGASTVSIGCSIGVASCRSTAELETALERADIAMYAAKGQGKNGVVSYSDKLGDELVELQQLREQLRGALATGSFLVHYQPIYSADRIQGQPRAAESLVRWASPDGLIPAGQFIPAAEQSSLVVEIDRWVFRQVLADLEHLAHFEWVSVNLSARTLHCDDLVEWVVRTTQEAGVDPRQLTLEITETAAMLDVEASIAKLEELRSLGFGVGLDDFGTGYSSIAYLRRLPVSLVKIDQSFIRDLDQTGDPALLKAIVTLSQTLELPVVAEGVEAQSQIATLQAAGCELLQGSILGEPLPLAEMLQATSDNHVVAPSV